MADFICNIALKNTQEILWSTWITGYEEAQQAEDEALIEAEAARSAGEFDADGELWVLTTARADAVANFPSNEAGSFYLAIAINDGQKPTGGAPRVIRRNGMLPGALMAQAISEAKAHSAIKQTDDVFVPFMIKDEGA